MPLWLRVRINRWRRWLWHRLFFRMLFGEQGVDGRPLPCTRLSPSTCIEHEDRLTLGNHVFMGHFNFIEASHGVRIDDGVQITNFVSVLTHSSHRSLRLMGEAYYDVPPDGRPGYISGPVHIGAYSFIGPHSVIEANTTLGRGCLVLSHSRVRGDFPEFSIIGGVPAVVVGDTREVDAALLAQHPDWRRHYEAWAASPGRAP